MKLRRGLAKWIGVVAVAVPSFAHSAEQGKPPNIVVILADDMGYGDARCYNEDSKIPTPHLDKLASEGMRFTDAHTPSSVCSPTRYAMLTGRYAWRTELKRQVLWAWDRPLIENGRLTMASMLNQHGYHTACIGKWHLGWEWRTAVGTAMPTSLKIGQSNHKLRVKLAEKVDYTQELGGGPLGAGFDYYFGDDMVNQPPYLWIENQRCLTQPTEPLLKGIREGCSNGPATPGWDQTKVLPRITDRAVQYLRTRGATKDRPFFLYFALTAPHLPVMPGEAYVGKSSYGSYGDFVHHVDAIVGQVDKALAKAGLAENTLVIFTSDNGSFAPRKNGHSPNGALRGKKGSIYEGGHRVPFIVRWPDKIKPGSVNGQLVGVNDLMATVAAIVGHSLPDDAAEDSVNFLPTLLDATKAVRQDLVAHSANGEFALRDGDWKLISNARRKPTQLYHLGNDPAESKNLIAAEKEVVARFAAKLERYHQQGRSVDRKP
ncbi:arylsulfatase [Oceaniferula spumae]|uniref:Arylsulfatase n=1 Tax=Oceaniferula spumae TaxID=2979115 RepID=A0AAT9FLY0_9BACT